LDEVEGVEDIGVGRAVGFCGVECWFVEDIWDLVFLVFFGSF